MKKYYIICWEGDGGDRESYSIFHSKLTQAINEDEAWNNVKDIVSFTGERKDFHIEEIKLH